MRLQVALAVVATACSIVAIGAAFLTDTVGAIVTIWLTGGIATLALLVVTVVRRGLWWAFLAAAVFDAILWWFAGVVLAFSRS